MSLQCSHLQKPLYHWEPNEQPSKLSLKVEADTLFQVNTMWVQVDQHVSTASPDAYRIMCHASWLCDHDACGLNIVSGSDGITTVSVFWRGKQKSCVSVYATMPGVNIIHLQFINSRHQSGYKIHVMICYVSLCLLACSTVCTPLRLSLDPVSLLLSLYQPLGPFIFMTPYLYITALLFY